MKVLILAGGFGTRLSEETDVRPKPMVDIGGRPILWHIMKMYSVFGFTEFVILLGYRGGVIKEFFSNYFLQQSDITVNLKDNSIEMHRSEAEPWKVTLLDTGLNTLTGGRIKRAKDYIGNSTFLLTYGDGVSNVNVGDCVRYHQKHGKLLTMTAVLPAGRYGALNIEENGLISSFKEKPRGDSSWINGGFFVCEPKVLDFISGDKTVFEQEPLNELSQEGELMAWKHHEFWACMDTLSDKQNLNKLWETGNAPWKIW